MSLMIFKWDRHQDSGETGWIAEGYPNFNPTAPGDFAHDCMEHFPRGIKHGAAADELLALGARLHIRVDSGWWWSQPFWSPMSDTFGAELANVMRDVGLNAEHDYKDEIPPIYEPELDFGDLEGEMFSILSAGAKSINGDSRYEIEEGGIAELTADSPVLQHMGMWLRRGARAARERYRGAYPNDIMELGLRLDEEAKRYKYGKEGDRLFVRVHEKNMEFDVRCIRLFN